jgi:hypothetical protein
MPSFALRTAWFRPRICAVILLLIAKPAASSAALLMRLPVDNCSMLLDKERLLRVKAFWLMSELMLVLMTVMIFALYEMCLKSF